jgi:hypothetical protein
VSKPKLALNPKHPERICWGCDKYCAADDLRCGNGTVCTQHPVELFGQDWLEWELGNDNRPISETDSVAKNKPADRTCAPENVRVGLSQNTPELLGLSLSGGHVG